MLAEAASGPASKWAPYIRTLPGSYTAACSFTEHDLEALHGFEVMQGKIRAAGTAQREAWRGARPALQALFPRDAKWRSLGAWLWAAATLSTRTMYMPGPGDEAGVALWGLLRRGEDPGALTPLGDFHNYAPPPAPYMPAAGALAAARGEAAERREEAVGRREEAAERREEAAGRREEDDSAELEKASAHARASAAMGCSGPAAGGTGRFDVERRVYCLLAGPAGVRTGDQVFLDYGRYDNEELLVLYGFVLRDNPHDRVLLGAGSFPAAAAAAAVGDLDPADRCLVCSGAPGWSLLRALRLAAATAEERRKGAWLALDDRPISVAGDALVATWLCAAAAHVQAGIRRALCRADQQPEQSPSPCAAVAREWLEAQLRCVAAASPARLQRMQHGWFGRKQGSSPSELAFEQAW